MKLKLLLFLKLWFTTKQKWKYVRDWSQKGNYRQANNVLKAEDINDSLSTQVTLSVTTTYIQLFMLLYVTQF